MSLELDPQLTFDTLVVGAGNRLAYAAARRVAEAPGTSYNPLFVYSASGLGKTHLLHGIGQHTQLLHPDLNVVYDSLEGFVNRLMRALETGQDGEFRMQLGMNTMLLLDDVQFLAGQHRMQEELLRAWDQVAAGGGQVVLTSDRPPTEIDGLDQRLLSRFSGGLIMDVAAPDYETRVAIARRTADRRGQTLGEGVAEALARNAFGNVRELQGALNKVFAVQELEGRSVGADEVPTLLGGGAKAAPASEFDSFLADITETVATVVAEPAGKRQLEDAVARWSKDTYLTTRLDEAIDAGDYDHAESLIRGFEKDVERLREIAGEIATLEPGSPELTRRDLLRDPERIVEADTLLLEVRARNRPLPVPGSGESLDDLTGAEETIALKAARAIVKEPARRYNPLFVWGPDDGPRGTLVAATAREMHAAHPDMTIGWLRGSEFADELIQALEKNDVERWRARYRRAHALFIDGVQALEGTERAQEELFHLFDALVRGGTQLVFGADRAPAELSGLEDRLRSRMEAGLVAEAAATHVAESAQPEPSVLEETRETSRAASPRAAATAAAGASKSDGKAGGDGVDPDRATPLRGGRDDWFRSTEKLLWAWPYASDWVVEEQG
ncbi:MAG TPA: DnaA/Hda family protein [Longimicrobiales bacterium]